jgi:hypothetical protein
MSYRIVYFGPGHEKTIVEVPPGTKCISLDIERRWNCPVAIYPVLDGISLLPSGAVYPEDMNEAGELEASWERGFLAECLLMLNGQSSIGEHVNVQRLAGEIREVSGGNPWLLDPLPIVNGFHFGNFSSRRIKMLPTHSIELNTGQEPLISWKPCVSEAYFTGGPVELPSGITTFFSEEGEHAVTVHISEERWMVWYVTHECTESGNG